MQAKQIDIRDKFSFIHIDVKGSKPINKMKH